LGTAEPIHHYPSPIRDAWRGRMLERRNDICFGIMDVPFPHVLCHLPGTICSGLMFGFRNGCLQQTLAGYVNALRTSRRAWRERRPVRGDTYMMIRRLNRHSLLPWSDLEPLLERNAARQRKASSGLSSETRPVES